MSREELTPERVWKEFEKALAFNEGINLTDTVRVNEDFFVGKQWEGVRANGLPTPVFNIIKRVVLYLVATTATDNIAMAVNPMSDAYPVAQEGEEKTETDIFCDILSAQFDALIENTRLTKLIREFMRDAAVRGDGCIYSYFDPEAETGQEARGSIKAEILENTRVFFGDPNVRQVQDQPYIIISRRERAEDVRRQARELGGEEESVQPESDELGDRFDAAADGKVTTLTRFEKREGTVWCVKMVKEGVIREEWDTGMRLYPIAWMSWDRVTGSYHGQAAVTGLIPNQVFVNKAFAMTMISLMTTAYPKVIFNKSMIAKWDSGVGKAIGVNGGDVNSAVKTLDPATISPQVSQFIELTVNMTKELMGATDAALGNVRPDNTSAILALQKSSSVPMELVKQELYQAIEELGRIWMDQMRAYYGLRLVRVDGVVGPFDFDELGQVPLGLKLDVGGSAFWSLLSQMQTLDNLLMNGHITIIDYLERLPNGFISNQQELIDSIKERQAQAAQMTPQPVIPTGEI